MISESHIIDCFYKTTYFIPEKKFHLEMKHRVFFNDKYNYFQLLVSVRIANLDFYFTSHIFPQLSVFQNVKMEEIVQHLVFVSAYKAGLESGVQQVHIINVSFIYF